MSVATLDKVVLVGLIWVIYAQVLPGTDATSSQLFVGTAAFVVVNAAVSLWVARAGRGVEPVLMAFGFRVLMNVGLVVLAGWLLARGDGAIHLANTLFFVLLLSLITLLDDRYRPMYEMRFSAAHPATSSTQPTGVDRPRGPVPW
jgi:hypothetical protein